MQSHDHLMLDQVRQLIMEQHKRQPAVYQQGTPAAALYPTEMVASRLCIAAGHKSALQLGTSVSIRRAPDALQSHVTIIPVGYRAVCWCALWWYTVADNQQCFVICLPNGAL